MNLQAFTPDNQITEQIGQQVHSLLKTVGENPERDGLLRTP